MKIKKLFILLTALIIFAACAVVLSCAPKNTQPTTAQLVDKIKHGVVEIATVEERGSGVIVFIGDKTEIITNYHVIETAVKYNDNIEVRFLDSDIYHSATVLGYFEKYDLALLEVDYKHPDACVIPFASQLTLAEDVLALGYNEGSLAAYDGIISMTERVIEFDGENYYVIQSTTGFAQGSSGGALVNYKGEFLGITTFGNSFNNQFIYSGTGYSVSAEIVGAVYDRIKKGVQSGIKPYIPEAVFSINPNGNLTVSQGSYFVLTRQNDGIYVSYAAEDCPFETGDKIATINGKAVKTMTAVISEIIRTNRDTLFSI